GQSPASATASDTHPITVTIGDTPVATMPALGLGVASHGQPLNQNEIRQLRALNLKHLRVDLDLSSENLGATLVRATQDANALAAALEIALFVGEDAAGELAALQKAFNAATPKV